MNELVNGLEYRGQATVDNQQCEICCEAKQTRLPFPSQGSRAESTLEIVHSDVCGPMETKSVGGSRYFLSFIDDYTRMCFVYFIKSKDEVFETFKNFKNMVEKQQSKPIKILRSDNGKEYDNKEFERFLRNCGIIHQRSNSYTPEQNGMAERFNRTIVERAKCLLFDQGLEKHFWAEAVNTAVYLKNLSVASGVPKTPYELWKNKKPNVSHLKIFGSPAMVHIPKQKRLKWDKKAVKHILVGYCETTKGYRLYNPNTRKIVISRDVTVLEEICESKIVLETKTQQGETSSSVGEESETLSSTDTSSEDHNLEDDEVYSPDVSIEVPQVLRRSQRQPKPRIDEDFVSYVSASSKLETNPTSVSEALSGSEGAAWGIAIEEELESFKENNAWQIADLPMNATLVGCKWVFKKKISDNEVKFRARLVAKGFTQKEGVDYSETFSPVVRHSTLRLLFALSVKLELDIFHLDVKTAFLNGHLNEEVFMKVPDGFQINDENKVLKLNKAIYGLKQSSRAWNDKVNNVLMELGYKRSKYEPCVFIKQEDNRYTIVTLYVDDFFIFSNSDRETCFIKRELSSRFRIKDLGKVKECLGMQVNYEKDKGILTLSQEKYIDQLLTDYNMIDCKVAKTPSESKLNFDLNNQEIVEVPYQRLIGSLMYLAVLTRPDIVFSVSYFSQFNRSHNETQWKCLKRILRYLKGSKSLCLSFSKKDAEPIGFVDADWGNNPIDRKSYTGFVFKFCGSVISWESNKQKTVALSSTEAEYMAISEAAKEAIYLKNLLEELTGTELCITLFNDNQSALNLSANHTYHKRSKHIDIKHHFIREVVSNKQVVLKYLPTNEMPADLLTKGLAADKHYNFLDMLGFVKNNCKI